MRRSGNPRDLVVVRVADAFYLKGGNDRLKNSLKVSKSLKFRRDCLRGRKPPPNQTKQPGGGGVWGVGGGGGKNASWHGRKKGLDIARKIVLTTSSLQIERGGSRKLTCQKKKEARKSLQVNKPTLLALAVLKKVKRKLTAGRKGRLLGDCQARLSYAEDKSERGRRKPS